MAKTARLDMRITAALKADLQKIADRERRRLTDLVEIVLTDFAAEKLKRK